MKTVYKILLLNGALALFFAAVITFTTSSTELIDFVGFLGMVSLFGGAVDLLIGVVLLLARKKAWAQGFLLSSGLLLLLGFALCSTMV